MSESLDAHLRQCQQRKWDSDYDPRGDRRQDVQRMYEEVIHYRQ